jgi:hypothetical protein
MVATVMTRAERLALAALAREGRLHDLDPKLPEWRALLESLRARGCASIATATDGTMTEYRITRIGVSVLRIEARGLEQETQRALGAMHAAELLQGDGAVATGEIMNYYRRFLGRFKPGRVYAVATSEIMNYYRRYAEEARELRDALATRRDAAIDESAL